MATAARDLHDQQEDDSPDMDSVLERARPIIDRLASLASEQVRKRQPIEERWIEALRAYWGKYDEQTDANLTTQKKSRAYVKLTRHKTNGWAARLSDLLFPVDGKNWGIKPTPLPELAKAAKEALAHIQASLDGANAADAQQNPEASQIMLDQAKQFADLHQLTDAQMDEVKKRCEAMEKAIDDQLTESRYAIQCRDVIEDGCRVGTGILKGPVTSQKLRRQWKEEPLGHWSLTTLPDPMPEATRVDYWHFFPDMSARTIEEAEFTFERHLPTRKDLRKLALKLGFSRSAVSRLLAEGPIKSQPENTDYLANFRMMLGEGEAVTDRYVMWEYHGALECQEISILLRAMGQFEKAQRYEQEKDEFEEYRVILYFCGNELLKIAPAYPLDSGETLYSVWNFEKGETSIFGVGVPELIADSQRGVNAAWRMMLDNAALSVCPQVVIAKDQITPQLGNDWAIKPGKVWLRSSTSLQTQTPAFETFVIPNNQQQLAGIIELGKEFIDEESSMPTIAQGEQGAASQTLGGMSILFNSANVVFRRVVKSWDDDLTTSILRRWYDWNMQFNPDEGVKGDMQVDARGTSVLLVREIQSQNLLNIVTYWSVHQVLGGYLKVREAMVKALETMMVPPDDVLKSQEQYEDDMQKAAEAAAQNPQSDPNAIKLQIVQSTNESREKIAEQTNDARLKEAQLRYETVMAQLQDESGLSRADLEAKYGLKHAEIASKERMKAVDIAVEDRRAAAAKADGQDEVDAVGQGVG
jgi:hypothetical protein